MAEPVRRRRRIRPASDSTAAEATGAGPEPATPAPPTPAPATNAPTGTGMGAEPAEPGYARAETSPVTDALVVGIVDLPLDADADITPSERGLRGLVGGGSSQIKPAAALRARDAARPRPEDLERAEAELTIVRRHWTPRE